MRIRHFGLLSNRFRGQSIALARTLIAAQPGHTFTESPSKAPTPDLSLWHCPKCSGAMIVSRRLSPMEINSS